MSVQSAQIDQSKFTIFYEQYIKPHTDYFGSIKGAERLGKGLCILNQSPKVFGGINEIFPRGWEILREVAKPLKKSLQLVSVIYLVTSVAQTVFDLITQNGKWSDDGKGVLRWMRETATYGADLGITICKHAAWAYLGWVVLAFGLIGEGKSLIGHLHWDHLSHPMQMIGDDAVFATFLGVAKDITSIARQVLFALGAAFSISLPALGITWAMTEFGIKAVNWGASYIHDVRKVRSEEREKKLHAELFQIDQQIDQKERSQKQGSSVDIREDSSANTLELLNTRKAEILKQLNA